MGCDVKYMSGLLKLGNLFGLCPHYDAENANFEANKRSALFSFFWFLTITLTHSYMLYMKIEHVFADCSLDAIMTIVISESAVASAGLTCLCFGSIWRINAWKQLWEKLIRVDNMLSGKCDGKRRKIDFYAENFLTLLITISGLSLFVFEKRANFHRTVFPIVIYGFFLWILIFYNFATSLKLRFRSFHEVIGGRNFPAGFIERTYGSLREAQASMDEVFGISTLAIVSCDAVLWFFAIGKLLISNTDLGMNQVYPLLNVFATTFTQFIAIIVICDEVSSEMNRTSSAVCELLVKFERRGFDDGKELHRVMNLSRDKLGFSAAGFFLVDKSLIVPLVAVILTFLVMLQQWSTTFDLKNENVIF